ncbi:MAG: hypothetical protein GEU71_18205 [Actinobacteria bacterium]|nr:hypothetical protein [Actinomycetota bacterium]
MNEKRPLDPRVSREGIHIDRDLAEAEAIEEELDSNVVGPYGFPDPRRRRTSGVILLVLAGGLAIGTIWNTGLWIGAVIAALVGVWFMAAAWPLRIDQGQALAEAVGSVGFPVGHASAAVTFHGIRSRPRWSVILYEATEPPDQRALVTIDAVDGTQPDPVYVEQL